MTAVELLGCKSYSCGNESWLSFKYRMLQQNQILQAVGLTTGFSWLWPYCGMRPTMTGTISSTGWTYIKREDVAVWQWIWGTMVAEPLPAPSTATSLTSLSHANAHRQLETCCGVPRVETVAGCTFFNLWTGSSCSHHGAAICYSF